jgi:hypothetical protein
LKVKEVAERALDRGVQNGTSGACKKSCTETILNLWEGNHGFDERIFKILKRAAAEIFLSGWTAWLPNIVLKKL